MGMGPGQISLTLAIQVAIYMFQIVNNPNSDTLFTYYYNSKLVLIHVILSSVITKPSNVFIAQLSLYLH